MRFFLIILLLAFLSPLFWLLGNGAFGSSNYLGELLSTDLFIEYIVGSLKIGVIVTFSAAALGTLAAWIVVMYDFPYKRLLASLLFMPLAIPSYINAMLYANAFESAGLVQSLIRDYSGLDYGEYYFPNIRSIGGVIFILTFSLYPYVYMMMRVAFTVQSNNLTHSALLLGCPPKSLLHRVAIPSARPALVAAMAIVMMESLVDFGVSSLYGVLTLNTGIYRTWQLRMDGVAAARLAIILSCFSLILMLIEKQQRGIASFSSHESRLNNIQPIISNIWQKSFAMIFCASLVVVGFIAPLIMLINFSLSSNLSSWLSEANITSLSHSLKIGALVALITLAVGLIFSYIQHIKIIKSNSFKALLWLANFGYSLSGNIIAVSVLLVIIMLQNYLSPQYSLLSNSIIGLLWGCCLRFFTVAYQNITAAFANISHEMQDSAAMLGCNNRSILWRVHLPLIKNALGVVLLLVFVDSLKELPATIMLRPFNMTPLSVRIYELAKDEMLVAAAPLALMLVLLSSVVVCIANIAFNKLKYN
jgi:iron(III) transport system permease protein